MKKIVFTLFLAFSFPQITIAQDLPKLSASEKTQLTKRIESAKSKYNAGDFQGALDTFQQAYDVYPHPDFLYRLALCHERIGNDQDAVRYYREFLAVVPEAPERPRIEKTIETIERRISRSTISVTTNPSGATVYINDVSNGAAGYSPTSLKLKPGAYTVIVERDGFQPIEELVELKAGQSVQLRYQLKALGGDPSVGKNGTNDTGPNPYLAATVVFTTIGVLSTVFTFVALRQLSNATTELEALEKNKQSVSRTQFESAEKKETTWLIATVTSASVATVSLITAYIFWNRSSYWKQQQRMSIVPVISGNGLGLGIHGAF